MASKPGWPVVRTLPAFLVKIILFLVFVTGSIMLWNDRRMAKGASKIQKPVGMPIYKA